VLTDDLVTLADSSVICQYLEDRHPEPPLYPRAIADRARARWLEEFADTRMGDVFIWRLFNQRVINRFVWGRPLDEAVVTRALAEDIPQVLDYLEGELPQGACLFGERLSIADIAIAAFFRNAAFAGFSTDAGRWPLTAAFVARVLDQESFGALRPYEDLLLRTPIPRHREALAAAGAPLTLETCGTAPPRRGVFDV
jgi:glutathione S-transferase